MPTKRQILDCLTIQELRDITGEHRLAVRDHRSRQNLVDAVGQSPDVDLASVLGVYSRDRLKELCRSLGIDDGGREKAPLIERLSGERAVPVGSQLPLGEPRVTKKVLEPQGHPTRLQLPPFATSPPPPRPPARTVDLSQLKSHLWASANILRGPVDASDFKTFIFPMLFFKRISDVWDEEVAHVVDDFGDPQLALFPENHRFQIPDGCHWSDVREAAANLGQALQHAMREIEKANPETLYGVFGDAQWTNKDRLSDELLKDLIEHFSKLPLGNCNVESDVLGDAYEYLIKKFADATNRKAGEFYTPRAVVRLMVNILDPKEGETIYDPACGTGGMLLGAVAHLREAHGDVKRLWGKLYGQERNLTTSAIARMNLFLHGIEDFQIIREDTLRHPAFYEGDRLAQFDCVIANPPFSLEAWGQELWESDPYGRAFAGVPPDKNADYAWVQHMFSSTSASSGRLAVVLPLGALFHTGVDGEIRKKLLRSDLIESVVALGPNLFYGTGIPACILVARRRKPSRNRNVVYFIDASDQYREGRSQNELLVDHVDRIAGWYANPEDRAGRSRLVPVSELERNTWSLYPALYLWNDNALNYASKGQAVRPQTLTTAVERLKDAVLHARDAEERLRDAMKEDA